MRFTSVIRAIGNSRSLITILVIGGVIWGAYFAIFQLVTKVQTFTQTLEIGLVGQPQRINPLWSAHNPIDDMLSKLFYKGLIKYDDAHNPVGELAETWEITEDQKGYKVTLKQDIFWQDGTPVSAADVVFTYQLIQSDAYDGPEKVRFQDVFIESTDDKIVLFTLKEPFSPFLESLTMPIMPRHIWEGLSQHDLRTAKANLNPIGIGNFTVEDITILSENNNEEKHSKISQITLIPTDNEITKFRRIIIKFYETDREIIDAYNIGEIDRFITTDPLTKNSYSSWANTSTAEIQVQGKLLALFYNLDNENSPAANEVFRTAFRSALAQANIGYITYPSAIPTDHWAYHTDQEIEILTKDEITNDLTSEDPITLVTHSKDITQKLAQSLITYFESYNRDINLESYSTTELLEGTLPERKFDIFLAEQQLGHDPDQYSFWHSSQTSISGGGQNISGYINRQADKALEDGRTTVENETRIPAYKTLQRRLFEDQPAVFLSYPPFYEISRQNVANDESMAQQEIWHPSDYLLHSLTITDPKEEATVLPEETESVEEAEVVEN